MTSTKPEIDQLTGTVISEQGGGEIVDGRQDPPMSVYADDESAEGGATPSLFADEEAAVQAVMALSDQGTEVYRTIVDVTIAVFDRAGEDLEVELGEDVYTTANAAFAYWLGNTVG